MSDGLRISLYVVVAAVAVAALARVAAVPLLCALLWLVVRIFYRVRVAGLVNLPRKSGALLVSNHQSWADGPIVGARTPRLVRFVMVREYFNHPFFGFFFRGIRAIPISEDDPPHLLRRSLEEIAQVLRDGKLVMIFPEGGCTRDGRIQPFRRGFEMIMRRLPEDSPIPIIPVCIDGLWGSIFSYEGGTLFWKRPRKFPYPLTIIFGPPLPPRSTAAQVQSAVEALKAD
ncbi:MAG: 1-acyl-sn-glycerol-3-phosphate acyltransferase [Candidatus Sumerlaeota bacterium]|nr:1-acyl-sn-glycerol-3-phosphate acyltransferase [Candidatus Sumerlaeota bacterium]